MSCSGQQNEDTKKNTYNSTSTLLHFYFIISPFISSYNLIIMELRFGEVIAEFSMNSIIELELQCTLILPEQREASNFRKDVHSHLRLFHIYCWENGPRATGLCIGVVTIIWNDLKKSVLTNLTISRENGQKVP